MDLRAGFHLAEWTVHPEQNRLSGSGGDVHLTSRAMDVLVHLAEHAGAVVSREDFSRSVWGETVVGDDAVTWCISELRRQLGDQASSPRFIKTIPKRGYRLVAPVRALDENAPNAGAGRAEPRPVASDRSGWAVKPRWLLALLALAGLAVVGGWLWLGHRQPAAQPDQSIAVLPFYNFSTKLHNPFSEGIHHDLLTRLSNVADLRVISSTSVRQYRDSDQPIPEIARELNVAWVMEGAIQQVGDEIQVNAQLIDAASDTHAWARTYRRELTAENLFAIQADIVDDIASAMQAHLSPDEADRVVRVPTENLEAYALMIRGATLLGRRTELAMRRAAELFRQAIDQDRDYPDAWAELADAQTLLVYYGHEDAEQTLPRARANAMTALELEPDLPRAHMVLGVVHMILDHNGPAALEALGRAHALSSDHIGWLAWMQAVAGNLDEGLALTQQQVQRAPASPAVNMSLAFLTLADGQPGPALDYARKARQLSPGYALAWLLEGQALLFEGRHREAITAMETALDHVSEDSIPEYRAWLAAAHAQAGETQRARQLTETIAASDAGYALGIARLGLGELDAALDALGRNGWNDNQTIVLRYHPFLDPLRDDERFAAIIRRLDRHWRLAEG
ncbi:winged helix-turn-helix domain-containing tetratricopeptide repeat protein [Wenzhouxiangella limi]|uniref:Tetratricopeptide repeat protein n=1 Tax=Wenzhouxiangella limi TaxID=2707351 RepID=A0A845V9D0_9GAMM|nr:winged helix-turn-helix domain-containing protein [Wenzhouxiangella limi]NDY96525.1 tetratricopeptide repeat protein [Wenzhouxiangella limi]